jgi:hypothetical protein
VLCVIGQHGTGVGSGGGGAVAVNEFLHGKVSGKCKMALQSPRHGLHGCISYGMFYLASQWTATGLNPV